MSKILDTTYPEPFIFRQCLEITLVMDSSDEAGRYQAITIPFHSLS
jgi:hypothetical protein